MRQLKHWSRAGLVMSLAAALTTAAWNVSAQDIGVTATEILIGEVQPMSGVAALIGKAGAAGSKLAVAEVNAAGGINGRKVRVLYEDDGYVPARSVQAVKKLIEDDKVFVLTGTSGSSHMIAMLPTIEEAKIPAIVHMAPHPSIVTPRRPNIFMIGPDYDLAGYVPIRYIVEKMGKKGGKFGILYQDDDFGKALLLGYQRAVKEFGLNSVAEIPYKRGTKDFSAEVLKAKSAGVDVMYNGGIISDATAILSEARRLDMNLTVATLWAGQLPAAIKLSAPFGYDSLIPDYYAATIDPAGAQLLELAKKYLTPDDVAGFNRYTVSGYVASKVMFDAIRRCGAALTRACVVAQLGKVHNFSTNGLTGPISLDNPKGQAVLGLKVFEADAKTATLKSLTDFISY